MALVGLEGTSGDVIDAVFIEKSSQIKNSIFNEGKAFTSAGSNGAINIWEDDEGFVRCKAMRYFATIDYQKYSKLKDVKAWTDYWLKNIGEIS